MQLKIGKPVQKQLHRNLYRMRVKFMEGDADGYEHIDIHFSQKRLENEIFNKELELYINTLKKALIKDSHGRGGYDNFEDMVEDFYRDKNLYRFFYNYNENLENEEDEVELSPCEELVQYFPSEEHGFLHSFNGLVITYFDNEGVEYEVLNIDRYGKTI